MAFTKMILDSERQCGLVMLLDTFRLELGSKKYKEKSHG
jgi:hypothetical protein